MRIATLKTAVGALSLLAILIAALAAGPAGAQEEPLPMQVWRVSADSVDVAVPTDRGPEVGTRLVVERGGAEIAILEVVAVNRLAVVCSIEREQGEILAGDSVRLLEPTPIDAESLTPPAAGSTPAGDSTPTDASTAANDEDDSAILVRQVMGQTVYLDAGKAIGLAPGVRAKVVRDGEEVAEVEVEFVSSSSAAARRLDEGEATIAVGDRVVPDEPLVIAESPDDDSPAGAGRSTGSTRTSGSRRASKQPWADLRGTVALRFQGFADGTGEGSDITQSAAVVNLRLRQIGGGPLTARIRLRAGQERIVRPNRPAETGPYDRFYELTLAYEPVGGATSWQVGRLPAGPEVGFDYLDGMLGEYRLTPGVGVGAFFGNRADLEGLSYDSGGQAYGAFFHHLKESADNPFYSEAYVSVIGEYRQGETNREYVSLYGRQGSGSRWSIYERAELDFNRDWRAENGASSYQVSNLLFAGTYTLAKAVRVGVSYDQRRRYLTLDDRDTPEELFDDALREGLRLNLYLGTGRSPRANLSAGLRRREGSSEKNLTYNASVYHPNLFGWNLLAGTDYAAFSGETSDGYRAGLRVQKYFSSGYDLEITVGRSNTTLKLIDQERSTQWVRLSGTAQLGRRFFLIGEYENTTGDDLAGERLFLQLGYRF